MMYTEQMIDEIVKANCNEDWTLDQINAYIQDEFNAEFEYDFDDLVELGVFEEQDEEQNELGWEDYNEIYIHDLATGIEEW